MRRDAPVSGPPIPATSDQPVQRSRGWSAYRLGRLLNQVRWRMEQAPFFKEALPEGGVNELFRLTLPLLRSLLDDPKFATVELLVYDSIRRWKEWACSEDAGAEADETWREYVRRARGDPDREDFWDASQFGCGLAKEVEAGLLRALKSSISLTLAFELGKLVDQGLRHGALIGRWCQIAALPQSR